METKANVVCPACGTELEISVKNNNKKVASRLEALKQAGFDVQGLFSIHDVEGDEYIGINNGGCIKILDDEEANAIFQSIKNNGDINNRRLFRRWVMAQTFRILAGSTRCHNGNVTATIQDLGWKYQWKMMVDEFYAQSKMVKHGDMKSYKDRSRWFNKELVINMVENYKYELLKAAAKSITYFGDHKFIGNHYYSESKIKQATWAAEIMASNIRSYRGCNEANMLYNQLKSFMKEMIMLDNDTKQNTGWINAYKGAGAFFTMQNMIRFHGCFMVDDNDNKLVSEKAIDYLETLAQRYSSDGWKMYGVLKAMLEYNKIDVIGKIKSWRK